jgi:hypothetical protein
VNGDEHQDTEVIEGTLVGHECVWEIHGTQQFGEMGMLLNPARTIVVLVCQTCHLPITQTLAGHWDGQQLKAVS